MGADKALLALQPGGPNLVQLAVRNLRPLVTCCVVVRTRPLTDLPADVQQIADPWPAGGPGQAVLGALEAVAADRWLVVACDMPRLATRHLKLLADRSTAAEAVVCFRSYQRLESLPALVGPAVLPVLREQHAAREQGAKSPALHTLWGLAGVREVELPVGLSGEVLLESLNTPAELAAAQVALRDSISGGGS
jgi:molybdopterin-guanine dinucleotide biosynthesis protein A